MNELVGQQLGRYHLTRLLEREEFSTRYQAEHVRNGTGALVRVLSGHLMGEQAALFEREAQQIAGLSHPHIAQVVDFDLVDGIPFFVQDYLPLTLRQLHPHGALLPFPLVIEYAQQVAQALIYAHERGITHGDVRPEHLLARQTERRFFLDALGLARLAQVLHMPSPASSSPYAAPEQQQGALQPASDQYALAVMSYEWLCGQLPPRDGSGALDSQAALRALQGRMPPAAAQALLRALHHDPVGRFNSVRQFLSEFAQGNPATSIPALPPMGQPALPQPPPPVVPRPPVAYLPGPTPMVPPPGQLGIPLVYTPVLPAQAPARVSRRGLIFGLAGGALGLSALGGAAYWYLKSRQSAASTPPALVYTYIIPAKAPTDMQSIVWSPDGQRLAMTDNTGLRTWDAIGGSHETFWPYDIHTQEWNGTFAWTQNALITCWSERQSATIHVNDALSGQTLFSYNRYTSLGQKLMFPAVAVGVSGKSVSGWEATTTFLSPEGDRVASINEQGEIRIWNARNGNDICVFHASLQPGMHPDSAIAVRMGALWLPDGRRLLTWSDNDLVLHIWDARSGKLLTSYLGHWPDGKKNAGGDASLDTITISPDGRYATSTVYGNAKTDQKIPVHIWDTANGNLVATLQAQQFSDLIWSPDSSMFTLNSNPASIINAHTGSVLFTPANQFSGAILGWSPHTSRIASNVDISTYDNTYGIPTFQVWDATSGKNVVRYLNTHHTFTQQTNLQDEMDGRTQLIAWSPNGQYIAAVTGSQETLIEIWTGGY